MLAAEVLPLLAAIPTSRRRPARSAGQYPAVFLPAGVDRAERRRGQRDKDARVVRDGGGDALAAGEPGGDELVGVGDWSLGPYYRSGEL
jgi:hypothetical protein